jgi:cysteinyl-tRNA synthetase
VNYVQNITDIDDKIIRKAGEEKSDITKVSEKYTNSYLEMMDKLNVQSADMYPKATLHVKDMIKTIEVLIKGGFAYVVDGDVYFEVAKFKGYGKLSGRTEKAMMAGARVAVDERKKSPLDFALWKAAKPGEPSWDSPWGKGRPGWHIECSAMSTKYLGETFDIHGGGLDLVFPHHENEIAQAEAATGKPFAKYWIHNGFVTINKEKMSKSLGNFFTIREILGKFPPQVIRLFLLSTHYRSPVNYSDDDIKSISSKFMTLQEGIDSISTYASAKVAVKDNKDYKNEIMAYKDKFIKAMDGDFNTAEAIGVIFELITLAYSLIKKGVDKKNVVLIKNLIIEIGDVLGLDLKETQVPKEIQKMVEERLNAKKNKDFLKADEIRKIIGEKGYVMRDTPYGTVMCGPIGQFKLGG